MLTIFSFLQGIYRFIKKMAVTVTKKMYRTAAVFVSMAAVVTVITLTSSGFGTGGRSVISAYAETVPQSLEEDEEETAPEEMNMITEAKIRVELTDSDSRRDGQLFAGSILDKAGVCASGRRESQTGGRGRQTAGGGRGTKKCGQNVAFRGRLQCTFENCPGRSRNLR